jgi:predicted MPP superfamily phosphohydrolase
MHPALLVVILLFGLLGHGYLWIGIVNRLHGWAGPRRLIDFLTLAGLILFLLLPIAVARQWWIAGSALLTELTPSPVAQFLQLYVLVTAFGGVGNLLAKFICGWREDDPEAVILTNRQFVPMPTSTPRGLLQGSCARLYGLVPGNQVLKLAVDNKRLTIPRLPAALTGMRIVHISDLHMTGRIGPEWFARVISTVNSLDADAIMLTGDLIENESCRALLNESLGRLRAKHGVYFVLGNHDYYVAADRTVADLTNLGLVYVYGKSLIVEWNGHPILIAGNERPWWPELADLAQEETLPNRPFRVVLMHTPDQFDWACASHADLALAGHTHGGQVCFPILGPVASPSLYGTRFARGTFKRGKTVMHVTRGISGETPMRWLCPPEIAVLELVPSTE